MARAPKTTPANTDTEGAAMVPGNLVASEQAGTAGKAAAAEDGNLSGDVSAPVAAPIAPKAVLRGKGAVMLTITGPKRGRRRAGREFGPDPVTIAAADLTEVERLALEADPALTIVVSGS
jgi:hypothetical protein